MQVLDGNGPWDLDSGDGGPSDLRIIHSPGRSFGSLSIWCQPSGGPKNGGDTSGSSSSAGSTALFSGGLLAPGAGGAAAPLDGLPAYNRAGRPRQARAMRALADPAIVPGWTRLLPAFGGPVSFADEAEMRRRVEAAAASFEADRRRLK